MSTFFVLNPGEPDVSVPASVRVNYARGEGQLEVFQKGASTDGGKHLITFAKTGEGFTTPENVWLHATFGPVVVITVPEDD